MKFLEKVKYIKEFNKKRFIYEGIYCFIEYLEYILVGCLYLKWIVTDVQSGKELSYILKKILGFTVILFLIVSKRIIFCIYAVFNLHYQKLYK